MAQPINAHKAMEAHAHAGGPIHIKPSHEGLLHKEMGVKEGQKIPAGSLRKELAHAKAEHNVAEERRIVFAENFGHKK